MKCDNHGENKGRRFMKKVTSILLIVVALIGLGGTGAAYYHLEQKRQMNEKMIEDDVKVVDESSTTK